MLLERAPVSLRWDFHRKMSPWPGHMYMQLLRERRFRAFKRWRTCGGVLITIQRMQKDAEVTAKKKCEEDLTNAMLLGEGGVPIEGALHVGLLRMVWEMGRATAGVKRAREE